MTEDAETLEDKIQRMREINAYEAARVREAKAEEERRRAEVEAAEKKRRQAEEELRRREREQREREKEQKRLEQEALKLRREQEERERRIQALKLLEAELNQIHMRAAAGTWNSQRALEHYTALADMFDEMHFTPDTPMTFRMVPWPVLYRPAHYYVEHIGWESVEDFFKAIKLQMRPAEYKAFVAKSHRRFHPDRWRARRVLASVVDEETKSMLEVAANTVAQALTPIWAESRSG